MSESGLTGRHPRPTCGRAGREARCSREVYDMNMGQIIRRHSVVEDNWDDPIRGRVRFCTLHSGAGLVQGEATIAPGDTEGAHHHDLPETAIVIRGRGWAELDGIRMPIEAGDTIFVPAGTVHAWGADDEEMTFVYTFPADSFDAIAYHFTAAVAATAA